MKENQNIEWKENWRDEYLRWLCGFANADGGVLVVGRNDLGVAVGVSNARQLLVELPNKVRDILGIMVDVHLRVEAGKELIEIRVEPYANPISYKGEYHYRTGSTKQELKGAALSHFLLKKQGRHWDGIALPGLKVGDLDAGALTLFRQQAVRSQRLPEAALQEPDVALLERLHLLDDGVCKRATALLFHADPGRWFTGAFVKIGFFESDADLRYQDEVNGPLLVQVNKIIEVLQTKYMKALISYDGLQRVETWPVPLPALREAVLNAVVHKDYTSGAPIQISVYPDKLMIWNSAQLSPEWTVARLLAKHASAPFNPDVANAFLRAGQIESWGRGIERMVQACLDAGLPPPVLQLEHAGVWVTFAFAKTPVETPVETLVETPVEIQAGMPTKTPERILAMLKPHPEMALAELAKRIDKSVSAVERATAKLAKENKLRYIGPKKGGRWEVLI
jgi:ATP-dependent DNA helicase RecG